MIPNQHQKDALSLHVIHLFRHAKHARLFLEGESIFQQGEPGDVIYMITDGEVAIVRDGACIALRGPGELIGEMAVLDEQPRYATAMAHTMCTLAPIDRRHFQFLIHTTPFFAIQVMRTLTARLREQHSVADAGDMAMSLESMYGW